MKIWDIENWNKGAKIRHQEWDAKSWIRYDGESFKNELGQTLWPSIANNGWQPFTEQPKTRKVKMYAPIVKCSDGAIKAWGYRHEKKCQLGEQTLVGWHEIEVEVEA